MTMTTLPSCDNLPTHTLTVDQAQTRILEAIQPLIHTETIPLKQGLGRVLAAAIIAPLMFLPIATRQWMAMP